MFSASEQECIDDANHVSVITIKCLRAQVKYNGLECYSTWFLCFDCPLTLKLGTLMYYDKISSKHIKQQQHFYTMVKETGERQQTV